MQNVIFVIGSVTTASRFKKILQKRGCYSAEVVHTPGEISGGGCSYSVRAKYDCIKIGLQISEKFGISIKKMYCETGDKERVYNDIS